MHSVLIITLLCYEIHAIEIVIIYFQLLFFCVIISFHDFSKIVQDVCVVERLCTSMTDEVSISKSCANPLTNHMGLFR